MTDAANLHTHLDRTIKKVDKLARFRSTGQVDTPVPISPLHFSQKIGFKPVVSCDCGSVLDTNKVKRTDAEKWSAVHQLCEPKREAGDPDA